MNLKEYNQKLKELEPMMNKQIIIREDTKTHEPYLSGHCVCPNTWHRVEIVDGEPFYGCNQCGCNAAFIDGAWIVGSMTPNGFISNKEAHQSRAACDHRRGYKTIIGYEMNDGRKRINEAL
jgi:hypothetical protein